MTTAALHYIRTAARPDIRLWLLDDDGTLVNLTGYTFVFKLGDIGQAAAFTKSTGITGAAGSGTETSGTPNATITFTAGELDALPAGGYDWQLRATSGGLPRVYQGKLYLGDVIL
jgi:hypothetical protein